MGYSKQVYLQAETELNARRSTAERRAQEVADRLYAAVPEAEMLRRRIASTASQAAKAVLRGGEVRASLETLKTENLGLQKRFAELLAENGMTRADLEPPYTCKLCSDTGYVDGRMCTCHLNLLRQIAFENLNSITPLQLSTFDSFSLEYYDDTAANGARSDREQMRYVFDFCKRYAENFSAKSANLLFSGATGLGKTHLSLAIAAEVIQRGFGVLYGSAQSFAVSLERERFSKEAEDGGTYDLLLSCDLLILDDLGMEISSAYIVSTLYSIVDSRIMLGRPTVISTNLSMQELEKRYNERFVSRVLGFYDHLRFRGADIRMKKKFRGVRG